MFKIKTIALVVVFFATIAFAFGMFSGPIVYTAQADLEKQTTLNAQVTMYTSDPAETDSTPFTTASNTTVSTKTAACPAFLRFGTKIMVNGRVFVCEDRMAKRYRDGNYFDLWVPEKKDAYAFGRQQLQVIIFEYENI
jgi:3D (Asp-Asp-Asp) domain-containing protein